MPRGMKPCPRGCGALVGARSLGCKNCLPKKEKGAGKKPRGGSKAAPKHRGESPVYDIRMSEKGITELLEHLLGRMNWNEFALNATIEQKVQLVCILGAA